MATANERLLDAQITHAVELERLKAGEVRKLQQLLTKMRSDVVSQIQAVTDPSSFGARRLQALLGRIDKIIDLTHKRISGDLRALFRESAQMEANFQAGETVRQIGIQIDTVTPAAAALTTAVRSKPYLGRTVNEWLGAFGRQNRTRVIGEIRMGFLEGEGIDEIVRRVRGTRTRPGVIDTTFREAQTIVRTGVNHAANVGREQFFEANKELLRAEMWVATLDGRTSAICRARDGQEFPVGEGPRPPAHPNCRSVMTGVLNDEALSRKIGQRPEVTDTRTRRVREMDFRKDARNRVGNTSWSRLTEKERRQLIAKERRRWTKEHVGTVPAKTTYQEWLKGKSAGFQDEVLGKTKGRLFRQGGLDLDKFVDRAGNELDLGELRRRQAEAFEKAGVKV